MQTTLGRSIANRRTTQRVSLTAAELAWLEDLPRNMAKCDANDGLRCVSFFAVNEFVAGWLSKRMFNSRVQIGNGLENVVAG